MAKIERKKIIKKVMEGRKEGKREERAAGEEGGRGGKKGKGREGGDIGQHIKFTAKILNPLGGTAELKERKGNHICNFLCQKKTM